MFARPRSSDSDDPEQQHRLHLLPTLVATRAGCAPVMVVAGVHKIVAPLLVSLLLRLVPLLLLFLRQQQRPTHDELQMAKRLKSDGARLPLSRS